MTELAPGWPVYRLGDVVENVNEYYDRNSAKPERYLAGDHIDEGSISVRRWGLTSDDVFPPTFNRRFRAGDVLFHSRNLRKLARPAFDGITGEKLFVLRVRRPDLLLPTLLPFVLQTVHFGEYVNRMWAGSTNKFLNKTPLMEYELAVPPVDEQREIGNALRAALAQEDSLHELLEQTRRTLAADLNTHLDAGHDPLKVAPQLPPRWLYVTLRGLITIRHGYAFEGELFTDKQTSDPILLTPGNFSESGALRFPPNRTKRFRGEPPTEYWLRQGDLVVLMTDLTPNATLLGAPGIVDGTVGPMLQNQRIGLVKNLAPERLTNSFLYYSFLGPQLRRLIRALSAGSTVSHTSPSEICSLRIPLPPIEIQDQLTARWTALSEAARRIEARLSDAKNLTATLRKRALRS
jgi:restriction endonuclease S subunit